MQKLRYFCTMKNQTTHQIYQQRIAAAIDHIYQNLDHQLTLAEIADVAHFSPFHFHRLFKAFRGEPLAAYITRLRVETAAQLLRHSSDSIETIAYRVGFEAPASLNKAFRALYDTTPTNYRLTNREYIMKTPERNTKIELKAPKIVELEPRQAIVVSLTGDYASLDFGAAFARLWAEVKAQKLFTAGIDHIAVYHDDPKSTDPAKLRTDVCLTVHKPAVAQNGVEVKTLPGGKYAVFTRIGPYDEVGAFYDAIYGEWVPANCDCDDCTCGNDCTCSLRDEPVFEKYCNDPQTTAPEKLKTEIYIPLK